MNIENMQRVITELETTKRPFFSGFLWKTKFAFNTIDIILIPKWELEPCCVIGLTYLDVMGYRKVSTSRIVHQTIYNRVGQFLEVPNTDFLWSLNDQSQSHKETAERLRRML